MAKFPIKESDVVALAETMVAGLTTHAADFPSVTVADLSTALNTYKTQRQTQENAKSQSQIATVTKDEKFDALVEMMKNVIKLSEVDVSSDPEKLTEIGWSPKALPVPIIAPEAPTDLHPIAEGQAMICLVWDKPSAGGPVRNYIIERRQQGQTGEFGAWTLVNTSYSNEFRLENQPTAVRLEYRVKASNAAGESMPSNSVPVVLY